jgi:hypothetical protein
MALFLKYNTTPKICRTEKKKKKKKKKQKKKAHYLFADNNRNNRMDAYSKKWCGCGYL